MIAVRPSGLPIPLQPVLAAEIAAGAGGDVLAARGFVEGVDGVLDREGFLTLLREIAAAAGRNGPLHRFAVEEREPFAVEIADDAAAIAVAAEPPPRDVEVVGAPGHLRQRALIADLRRLARALALGFA